MIKLPISDILPSVTNAIFPVEIFIMFDNQSCIAGVNAKKRRWKARLNLTHQLQKVAPSNMY
jgi:hypothetical protein